MSEEPNRRIRCRRGFLVALVAIPALSFLATTLSPHFPRFESKKRREWIRVLSDTKNIVIALRGYARDWEGQFPDSLEDLYPDYIDDESLLTAVGPDGDRRPWIYHGGKTDSSFSRDVLIEYPFPINGRRIAGFAGGHVSEMPAANAENP